MNGQVIIFLVTVAIYIPLACVLLYVWWKHGKDEGGVSLARIIFLAGSVALFAYMMVI